METSVYSYGGKREILVKEGPMGGHNEIQYRRFDPSTNTTKVASVRGDEAQDLTIQLFSYLNHYVDGLAAEIDFAQASGLEDSLEESTPYKGNHLVSHQTTTSKNPGKSNRTPLNERMENCIANVIFRLYHRRFR